MEIKTMKQWMESKHGNFNGFAKPGDAVDDEIADHFLNFVPPATQKAGYFQCGEPYSHQNDEKTGKWRATYSTFTRNGAHWIYRGHCFRNEVKHREEKII